MKFISKVLFLILLPVIGVCQNDSVVITNVTDQYVEIKSLRHVLDSFSSDSDFTLIRYNYIPQPVTLKRGAVVIKDRHDSLLALYIYSDSAIIQEDHYKHGKLRRQFTEYPKDSITIQKYYWDNGNLQELVIYNKDQIVHEFPADAKLQDPFLLAFDKLFSGSNNRIDIGCGWAGVSSNNINEVTLLLIHKKIGLLFKLLSSETPSTQYLAVEALLILQKEQDLDSVVISKIESLKTSDRKVIFCSGCTNHDNLSIRFLLSKKGRSNCFSESVRGILKADKK